MGIFASRRGANSRYASVISGNGDIVFHERVKAGTHPSVSLYKCLRACVCIPLDFRLCESTWICPV